MIDFDFKDRYNIDDLVKIVKVLRSDDGCPWDKVQTHESIRQNLIEEAYETADAIDLKSYDALKEETGDLLLQVVFHAVMAEEKGEFVFDDVVDAIVQKLVFRHPHVFGSVDAQNSEQALDSWEKMKKVEKNQETCTNTLKSVPKAFPSLMKAEKIVKRASKSDLFTLNGVTAESVCEEISGAEKADGEDKLFEAMGDALFSVTTLCKKLDVDAELALEKACDRFISRFEEKEKAQ